MKVSIAILEKWNKLVKNSISPRKFILELHAGEFDYKVEAIYDEDTWNARTIVTFNDNSQIEIILPDEKYGVIKKYKEDKIKWATKKQNQK